MLTSWTHRSILSKVLKRLYTPETRSTVIFAIGNPSTDKDTFIANLARDFDLHQIIIGPWLSSLRDRKDEVGALARKHWEKQVPMPANHIVPLLKAHLNELRDQGSTRFLVDGFPRTKESAEVWDRRVGKHNFTIYFETPTRRASSQYAEVVRKRFDSVSGEDERRLVSQRFEEHEHEAEGLLEYLSGRGRVAMVWTLILLCLYASCRAVWNRTQRGEVLTSQTEIVAVANAMLQIAAPDDSNKSYAKVLDELRKHPAGAKIFQWNKP
jgi:UMP-CMP kinase